ncbi:MAG: nucleotidyltransferase family protein, partial [Candidatus Roseilinea sp.]|uniref:nucleotidyltransferase family protein n=1 Tax=Candidatus Roseilinea sp. TaxID=2838777 RepID=UPI00404A67F5
MSAENNLNRIREQVLPALIKHGVQKAIAFGSFGRGEPSPRSDLDLLLIQNTDKRFFDPLRGTAYGADAGCPT